MPQADGDRTRTDTGEPAGRPTVTIFGAGITGLAAAHELIERGFIVQVLEPTESRDHYGHVKIGGMAASQYSHIPVPSRHNGGGEMRRARRLFGTPEKIYFESDDTEYDPDFEMPQDVIANEWEEPPNSLKLKAVAARLADAAAVYAADDEQLVVQIIGHTDDAKSGKKARKIAKNRAKKVRDALVAELGQGANLINFEIVALGSAERFGDNGHPAGRARNNRVEFEIEELRLPGEHGYRFYPAFYHNLDDQMRRIPVYDEEGNPTHRSVLDNLKPAPLSRFAAWDRDEPIRFPRKRPRSIEELRSVATELYERLRFPLNDISFFEAKLFRFMTSSHERRLGQYSAETWWDFVEGRRYSEVVQRHMRAAPQALVAMSVEDTDAHTAGNIYLQLMLDQLGDGSRTDRALNGPTSEAWLRHWKRYLDRQGVKFYCGKLRHVEADADGKLVAQVSGPTKDTAPRPEPIYEDEGLPVREGVEWMNETDYYVLALPALQARSVLQCVPDAALDITLRQVKHYDVTEERNDDGRLEGPLRDFVGIQFYFENDFAFARGYVYYPDSSWGLSSISQLQFWRRRRTRDSGYLGILSVDIGDMQEIDTSHARWSATRAFDAAQRAQRAADEVTGPGAELAQQAAEAAKRASAAADEARNVRPPRTGAWGAAFEQALESASAAATAFANDVTSKKLEAFQIAADSVKTCAQGLDPDARTVALAVEEARLAAERAHAARHLAATARSTAAVTRFAAETAAYVLKGKTAWGSTPDEIAKSVWRQIKLGLDPTLSLNIPEPLWYRIDHAITFGKNGTCKRNAYPFQINRAGEFAKRPGRMPGAEFYEVCNGGWVIAGMYTKTFTRLATMELAAEAARHAVNAIIHHRAGQPEGRLRGDFCWIFNPEDDEIDDLATLKRVDARLYADNLPHFMDILGWEQAIEALTRSSNPIADLGKLVTSSVNTFRRDWNMNEMTPEEMRGRALDFLERMVKAAHQLLGN